MSPDEAMSQLILNAAHEQRLSYVRPSDEWMISDGLGTVVLADFLQDRCHQLVEAGLLPEFADVVA